MEKEKIYFISDLHLGSCIMKDSHEHEKKVIRFLDSIEKDCSALWLLGDVFDFWFEYRRVVPKGFVRFLGKLAEFTENGIEVHFFTGNHDMWINDYLEKECGLILHKEKYSIFHLCGKKLLLGHGDGLDEKDKGYLFLRSLFHNRTAQFLFRLIHPDLGIMIADKWSSSSKKFSEKNREIAQEKIKRSNEATEKFCIDILKKNPDIDAFIFGHIHSPIYKMIKDGKIYINTGDWLYHFSYAVLDGQGISLKTYQS